MNVELRGARAEDLAAIDALIMAEHLPAFRTGDFLDTFWVLEREGRPLGCVGLEVFGEAADQRDTLERDQSDEPDRGRMAGGTPTTFLLFPRAVGPSPGRAAVDVRPSRSGRHRSAARSVARTPPGAAPPGLSGLECPQVEATASTEVLGPAVRGNQVRARK